MDSPLSTFLLTWIFPFFYPHPVQVESGESMPWYYNENKKRDLRDEECMQWELEKGHYFILERRRTGIIHVMRVIKVTIYGVEGFMRLGQEKGHNSCRDNRRYGKFYMSWAEFMQWGQGIEHNLCGKVMRHYAATAAERAQFMQGGQVKRQNLCNEGRSNGWECAVRAWETA